MTDPLDALRAPVGAVDPDPLFAARLRERLRDALLDPTEDSMTETTGTAPDTELTWGPTLAPYLAVDDARRAIDWYADVFGARRRGEPYVMPDGSIGHAELAIGDAVLMLSDATTGAAPVAPPSGGPHSHTVHVQLPDVDATLARAREHGATVEREPADQPYGRSATLVDPFGHRWLLLQPPAGATRLKHGDIGYVTVVVPDDAAARDFYSAVLGWQLRPGTVEHGWQADDVQPMVGLWGGGPEQSPGVQLCYRVTDVAATARRVTEHGGQAGVVERKPYGLMVECTDDQGLRFQLWEPAG